MLTLSNVSKSLGGKRILKNITFSVDEGRIFGYLGPNGAGKTTTIRIILGLYERYEGAVLFGVPPSPGVDKSAIGFLHEDDGLYGGRTLLENLRLYADIYRVDAFRAGRGIDELLSMYDLSGVKDEKISIFSHGMRRKAALVRAVFHEPRLLVLDEPFNGLDPDMQVVARDHLVRLARERGTTVFFSSHNLYEVERICDAVAIIRDGEIKLVEDMRRLRERSAHEDYGLEHIYMKIVKDREGR
ncbi:MAG TPA: ABC transporter ATP-binding protein [Patescibacteria group bacterium]|nr:ABC transporter ATP-binding protein [Patescibacteria group bacterium]